MTVISSMVMAVVNDVRSSHVEIILPKLWKSVMMAIKWMMMLVISAEMLDVEMGLYDVIY